MTFFEFYGDAVEEKNTQGTAYISQEDVYVLGVPEHVVHDDFGTVGVRKVSRGIVSTVGRTDLGGLYVAFLGQGIPFNLELGSHGDEDGA